MIPLLVALLLGAGQSTGTMSPTSDLSSNRVKATGASQSRSLADWTQMINTTAQGASGGTLPFAATGSTTPRTPADRAADVVNVKDFGATGNGTTDDTAAIQAAINAATPPGAGAVEFPTPSAYYNVTAPLRIPHGVVLRGHSRAKAIGSYVSALPRIQKTTTTTVSVPKFEDSTPVARDAVFYVDPVWSSSGSGGAPDGYYPQQVIIEGLSIAGSDATSTAGVYFEQGGDLTIRDSDFSGVKYAFLGRNIWRSSFERIKANARFEVQSGGTSLKFDLVAACGNTAGFDGFHLTNVTYSSFINTTCDGGHESAYTLTNCQGVTFVSPGAESTHAAAATEGAMFNFKGSNVVAVTGAFTVPDPAGLSTTTIAAGNGDIITFVGAYLANDGAHITRDLYVSPTARVTFINSQFKDASNNSPTVAFASPGSNGSIVAVHYDGNWKRYLDGVTQQNPMPASSVFTAGSGSDAFVMTQGARINLGGATLRSGTGSPEGVITSGPGGLYVRTDGGAGTTWYVKETGSGNTGWVAK